MENKMIKITTNTAIKDNDNTFAVARIAGFRTIKNLVWDEKDAIAVGVKIKNFNGTYTQETMTALQEGYLAHLRKCVRTLRSMVSDPPGTLVVKPFQVEPLQYALQKLGGTVIIDKVQPQYTNATKLPIIGCGRVTGNFKGGVSNSVKGGMASAILLPYEGYNFDPEKDPCQEVHGVVSVGNEAKLGFFIFVAAKTKDAAKNMIRSWIDRKLGKEAIINVDKDTCNKHGIYPCFTQVSSNQGRRILKMAFECEHLDGPQFVYAKETVDMNSCADLMALLQSQKTEIAALKAENSELRAIVDELRIAVAQLQVKVNKNNDDGDDDNNDDGNNNDGGNNTIDPSNFEDFSYATLEDEPQPEPTQETSQVSTSEQEESEPEQPEPTPKLEQPEVATAITEETIEAIGKFLSFANEEIQEDGLFKVTDEEKQKAELAKKAKVQRALKALAILGVSAKEFTKLVKKAKGQRVIKVLKFYDIKVENGAVLINQQINVEDWNKLDIGENGSLIVSC